LANKITQGGGGVWGKMDMPPFPELTPAELQVLALGVLASGKIKHKKNDPN
jgi:cytochrome c551/c552